MKSSSSSTRDVVAQASKPAVSPTSQSAVRDPSQDLQVRKPSGRQVCKSRLPWHSQDARGDLRLSNLHFSIFNFQFAIFCLLVLLCLSSRAADLAPTTVLTNSNPSPGEGQAEPHPAAASSFDSANNLYYAGKFTDAVAAYENILFSGQKSVALYYNLGNAYFKSGQIGKAIAAYLQAERLTPRDPDIRANLQFARNQIQGPTLAPTSGQRLLGKLTLNEWTLLAAAGLWLCFLFLALREWRPALKRPLQLYLSAAAIATILLCACVTASWLDIRSNRKAVVTSHDAMVHRGPLDESPSAFTVHDGAELRVLDQNNDWLQVTSDPSRIGWLRRDQVLLSPQT